MSRPPLTDPSQRKRYSVSRLRDRHHVILRLVALGRENKEIAGMLGVTPQTVSDVRNSPLGQARIQLFRSKVNEQAVEIMKVLETDVPKNYKLLMEIRDGVIDDSEEYVPLKMRMDAATHLLNREGHGPTTNTNFKGILGIIGGTDIEEIKKKAKEASSLAANDGVEDAQVEEVA